MPNVEKLLTPNRIVGIINPHPDDELSHASILRTMRKKRIPFHGLVLTAGEASDKNYHQQSNPNFSVKNGDRKIEEYRMARKIGMASLQFLDAQDGEVLSEKERLAETVAMWALEYGINTFVTLGLTDHIDHESSNYIAHLSAQDLFDQEQVAVDTLAVQHDDVGDWIALDSLKSRTTAANIIKSHPSQFRLSDNYVEGWAPLTQGHFPFTRSQMLHPYDADQLQVYPYNRDAHYIYQKAGSLVMPQLTLAA
jgi:LmbE family N-acetylglucosaminyl deacetylase